MNRAHHPPVALLVLAVGGCTSTATTGSFLGPTTTGLAPAGLSLAQVKEAMASIGYSKQALHELEWWESKRTTGRFGR
jgi:hypothetical protein